MTALRSSQNLSLDSGEDVSVGAYALIKLTNPTWVWSLSARMPVECEVIPLDSARCCQSGFLKSYNIQVQSL